MSGKKKLCVVLVDGVVMEQLDQELGEPWVFGSFQIRPQQARLLYQGFL
jgi:hypothetical protein